MKRFQNKTVTSTLVGIYTLLLIVFIISGLYIGQTILIPFTLSILLTFLLSPLVTRLERYIGRIMSVLATVILIFSLLGMAGYVLSQEFIDLVTKIPSYKQNIEVKLRSFHIPQNEAFSKLIETVDNLKNELPELKEPNDISATHSSLQASVNKAPVNVVESKSHFTDAAQFFVSLILNFSFTLGLVILLVIFMLINRENLKGRIIKLIGQGNIGPTTRAMDEAGDGVFYYIFMQLLINIGYGVLIAIGLYFIGIPNSGLWGGLIIVLRFIPYVGTWIAAAIPVLLSFFISTSWMTPLLTIGLYLTLDLISSNLVEPLVYEASVGISSLSFIISAVFWTLLWGPIGLILAAPITVCLIVIGRHVPQLQALSVLLSNEHPLSTQEECYHLLLRDDVYSAMKLIDHFLKDHSVIAMYDTVLIPILVNAEKDFRRESIDGEEKNLVYESIKEIIEDMNNHFSIISPNPDEKSSPVPSYNHRILCLPVKTEQDEIAALMLTLALQTQFDIKMISRPQETEKMVALITSQSPDSVLLSVTPPSTFLPASFLCKKLRNSFPQLNIIIGLWGVTENKDEVSEKLRHVGASHVVFSLEEADIKLKTLLKKE